MRRLYQVAGTIVVHHDYVRRRLVTEFGVDDTGVHLVHLPVIRREHPSESRPSDRPPCVLFFGTFRDNKGIPVLLDAIRRLPRTQATFVFAGRGTPELERRVVDAAKGDDRIRVEIDYATAVRKQQLFAGADLLVLPYTKFASQSAVLHDAYAHGVPALVTDEGALGESVREDGTGWVVPASDPEALAEGLCHALTDEAALRRAAAATDVLARDRSPLRVGRQLRALYARLLDESRAG
ncbi:MAG: glycosyltransferase family 4 protein [Actinobacteria bacterium]|nr:glycosyltransferase family 4 protein [Actinomycetota bacterium]